MLVTNTLAYWAHLRAMKEMKGCDYVSKVQTNELVFCPLRIAYCDS
jgi:hypothetical protein